MSPIADPLEALDRARSPLSLSPSTFERHGDEFCATWTFPLVSITISRVRDGSRGMAGELRVTHGGHEVHWGELNLASTAARETVVKKLTAMMESEPWRLMLEYAVRSTRDAVRQGEPFVILSGRPASPTRALLPTLLYEGEPTELYGDGNTGKSLVGLTLSAALQSGASLPGGLTPSRAVRVVYLDWETHSDVHDERLGLIAAGLGIDPPPIVYKRMTRCLADEASTLAGEFSRRQVGCVVVDSKMYALGHGEFHETVPAFYSALRLFAPAAALVINHITNDDARNGRASRPFGGACAFNGPRLIWEAKRDREVTDATAIAFTCTKANNLPRTPEPFGLCFAPSAGTITVYPLDLAETAPQTTAGASLTFHVRLALARGVDDPETIAKDLAGIGKRASAATIERLVRRERQKQEPRA